MKIDKNTLRLGYYTSLSHDLNKLEKDSIQEIKDKFGKSFKLTILKSELFWDKKGMRCIVTFALDKEEKTIEFDLQKK